MYVVLEGIDTCGKSTQISALKKHFKHAIFTKEPGGSALGVQIRNILLGQHSEAESKIESKIDSSAQRFLDSANITILDSANIKALDSAPLSQMAEFFLFLADRAQHCSSVILPNQHRLIIADRSLISGIAYASEIPQAKELNLLSMQGISPDICFVFNIDKATLQARLKRKKHDNIESRGIAYLLDIQHRLIQIAKQISKKTITLDASAPKDEITRSIVYHINAALESKMGESKIVESSAQAESKSSKIRHKQTLRAKAQNKQHEMP